jgi:hypothetical protein
LTEGCVRGIPAAHRFEIRPDFGGLFAEALVRRLLVLSAVLMLSGVGCVERRMTIRSNPSNALVILDGQEIGFTPVSVPFHYYGVRQIKLVKDGYETKIINQHVTPPWYQRYGVDFVSEVLIPWRIRDERDYGLSENEYTLQPKVMVPQDQLLQRAEEVRMAAHNPPPRALQRAKVDESVLPPPPAFGETVLPANAVESAPPPNAP